MSNRSLIGNTFVFLLSIVFWLLFNISSVYAKNDIQWIKGYDNGLSHAYKIDKPIFIYFYAPWCSWCYVYEQNTLGDAEVVKILNQYFVPVLVNFDARPDLIKKYRGFGLPFTIILSPKSELLARIPGILSPQDMTLVLQAVMEKQRATKLLPKDANVLFTIQQLDKKSYQKFLANWLDYLDGLYSYSTRTFSGALDIGTLLKRPAPRAWAFIKSYGLWEDRPKLAAYTMLNNLFDSKHGGFFYFRDWHRADQHLETAKLVDANAWLIHWFALIGKHNNDRMLLAVSQRSYHYLKQTLWDSINGGFFQAQVADSEYYKAIRQGKSLQESPAIDRIKRTSSNAQVAVALIKTAQLTHADYADYADYADEMLKTARKTINYLLKNHLHQGRLYHSYRDGELGKTYNLAEDIFWLLAAIQLLADIEPSSETTKQSQEVYQLANQWLKDAMQNHENKNYSNQLSNQLLSIIAWVAINNNKPVIPTEAFYWAMSKIRLENLTRPDDLVYALKAWQEYLQQENSK